MKRNLIYGSYCTGKSTIAKLIGHRVSAHQRQFDNQPYSQPATMTPDSTLSLANAIKRILESTL